MSRDRRRAVRALGYLATAPLLVWTLFASTQWWVLGAAVVVEAWWLWAICTDPGLR